jgi:hypothetical protein
VRGADGILSEHEVESKVSIYMGQQHSAVIHTGSQDEDDKKIELRFKKKNIGAVVVLRRRGVNDVVQGADGARAHTWSWLVAVQNHKSLDFLQQHITLIHATIYRMHAWH